MGVWGRNTKNVHNHVHSKRRLFRNLLHQRFRQKIDNRRSVFEIFHYRRDLNNNRGDLRKLILLGKTEDTQNILIGKYTPPPGLYLNTKKFL